MDSRPPASPPSRESKALTWYFCSLVAASAFMQLAAELHWLELPRFKGWITLAAVLVPCVSLALLLVCRIPFRRKVQISLRQAFCIVTAISLPLAGLGREIQLASRQRQSLARFEQNPASWHRYSDDHYNLRKTASWPKKCLFDTLGDDFFFHVEWLDISGTSKELKYLNDIRYLHGVNLRHCPIDDGTLLLFHEQPYLMHLGIDNTAITDQGLQHLHSAKNLEELWLRNTHVTMQGIQLLQAALPNCRIHHSFRDGSE